MVWLYRYWDLPLATITLSLHVSPLPSPCSLVCVCVQLWLREPEEVDAFMAFYQSLGALTSRALHRGMQVRELCTVARCGGAERIWRLIICSALRFQMVGRGGPHLNGCT